MQGVFTEREECQQQSRPPPSTGVRHTHIALMAASSFADSEYAKQLVGQAQKAMAQYQRRKHISTLLQERLSWSPPPRRPNTSLLPHPPSQPHSSQRSSQRSSPRVRILAPSDADPQSSQSSSPFLSMLNPPQKSCCRSSAPAASPLAAPAWNGLALRARPESRAPAARRPSHEEDDPLDERSRVAAEKFSVHLALGRAMAAWMASLHAALSRSRMRELVAAVVSMRLEAQFARTWTQWALRALERSRHAAAQRDFERRRGLRRALTALAAWQWERPPTPDIAYARWSPTTQTALRQLDTIIDADAEPDAERNESRASSGPPAGTLPADFLPADFGVDFAPGDAPPLVIDGKGVRPTVYDLLDALIARLPDPLRGSVHGCVHGGQACVEKCLQDQEVVRVSAAVREWSSRAMEEVLMRARSSCQRCVPL